MAPKKHEKKAAARSTEAVPVHRWFQFLEQQDVRGAALPVTLLFSLLVRWCVALHGYSGFQKPPIHGDYEAQRHWMEITTHLPASEWYFYDLQYWGLDYPPLTAFQSWVCGCVANLIDPSWVALGSSRGTETHESKLFMRASVVILESIVYVPAVVLLFMSRQMSLSWAARQATLFTALLQPCLLLVDHGHFQYNSVMLGFLVWSVYFATQQHYVLMAISFCCSLLFKQMALYFAPAVFAFLLAKCFQRQHGLMLFVKLGLAVIGTFGIMLLPWIRSPEQLRQILIRVFPVARGLYEDKVANVWCALNVVVKLRTIFEVRSLLRIAAVATGLMFAPSCIHLFVSTRRLQTATSPVLLKLLCYSLLNTSLAFFLFSFQVHEKSILLPLAPALLLAADEHWAVNWFVQVGLFSMYPLLFRDGLQLPYWVLAVGWSLLRGCPAYPSEKQTPRLVLLLQWLSTFAMVAIHVLQAFVPPPSSLPDIYVVANVLFSCAMFGFFFLYFNYRQFTLLRATDTQTKLKTQ
ncbi:Glucosyltransferase-like protein [Coemansia sp. RSA 1813]|nr:Glucosyltransferase-like protein [Coemansia sp. RSA 1646]KAJ1769809.1 Glucosyltransferase-like protein [Coemansia sp. RSA 1843]KAJ2216447.1 Glucosyltransferase-like protein [Coemansia sp. RSA 487]KAJ2571469.1 Glucosyltransferase-like protein [Coemansia sp. RSA 1813]